MSGDYNKFCEFGGFRLDPWKKILWHDGHVVSLPLKAIELLCVLVENRGEVVTKNALMDKVWGDAYVADSVLTQNIYLLRKTFLETGAEKNLIQNVPRRGYLFSGKVTEIDGAELIIERHLFEQVRLEEIEEGEKERKGERQKNIALPGKSASPTFRLSSVSQAVLAGALILSLGAVGAYFYLRNASTKESPSQSKNSASFLVTPLSSASTVKYLAVLPLESKDQYLSSSFTNDLTSRLGSLNEFLVRPFALIQKHQETGAELKADFVLRGMVEATRDKHLLVEAQLFDARSNAKIWKQSFDDTEIIRLQDAIANQVAQTILNQLSPEERKRVSRRLPTNIPAYETFMTGYLLWRMRSGGVAQSIPYFQKAIELDASFAQAYAALASAKAMMGVKDSTAAREAQAALTKAHELDEGLADFYAVKGLIQMFHHRDWPGAEESLHHALKLDPNCINAHHWLGVYFSIHRRLDEAKSEMHTALELDPTSPTLTADIGQLHYFARERDAAIEFYDKALALAPNHRIAAQYLIEINRPEAKDNKEAVLRQLRRAADAHAFALPYMNVDPRYDSLRDDSRFREVLRRINLLPDAK